MVVPDYSYLKHTLELLKTKEKYMSNITFPRTRGGSYIEWLTFSDNTETCTVKVLHKEDLINLNHIQVNIEAATRDLIRIGLVKDALDRLGCKNITLYLPYTPQARADRVFSEGSPLPIKVFCAILNSYGFDKITILDPHSDVTPALINNVEVQYQEDLLKRKLPIISKYMGGFKLCAPDLGAIKKIFNSVQNLGHKDYIQAIKIRDVVTGEIIKCDVLEETITGEVLIVDDICDGGASFKYLAEKLKEKGASKVGLYVTHGIFSKGLKVLEKDIDFIFVEGIVGNYINNEDVWRFNER